MNLSERQQTILAEIGIPIWQRRNNASNEHSILPIDNEPFAQERYVIDSKWAILIDQSALTPETERLLAAILVSIGLTFEDVMFIYTQPRVDVVFETKSSCTVIIFGSENMSNVLNTLQKSLVFDKNKDHYPYSENVELLSLPSLSELICTPALKQKVWQLLSSLLHHELTA